MKYNKKNEKQKFLKDFIYICKRKKSVKFHFKA